MRRPQLPAARRSRRAFTLIEVLVVMGIIVLLIALALPAFNFVTGSRSAEAATNQLASVLGIARAEAIGVQQIRGVAIYHDVDRDRTVAAIVEFRDGNAPFVQYAAGSTTVPVTYTRGQYVNVNTQSYVCLDTYADSGGTTPAAESAKFDNDSTKKWREIKSYDQGATPASIIEYRTGTDFMTLPAGIDVRSIGNTYNVTLGTATPFRYSNPAVILFDANGQVISRPYRLFPEGLIGHQINFAQSTTAKPVPSAVSPTIPNNLESGVTVNPFRAVSGLALATVNVEEFRNATASYGNDNYNGVVKIEEYLDLNAAAAMVNRYNGTLVKGD